MTLRGALSNAGRGMPATDDVDQTPHPPSDEPASPRSGADDQAGADDLPSEWDRVSRAWAVALWRMMDVGLRGPAKVAILCGDQPETPADALQCAKQRGVDVICLHFGGRLDDGPTNLAVASHGRQGLTLSENCELWASTWWTAAEILSTSRRYRLVDSVHLASKPNNLDEMRARRVARARERWRKIALEIAEQDHRP